MPAMHATLSPSGAKLDLQCPGNRREQKKCPRSRSEAADKGTGAHRVGEQCLRLKEDTPQYLGWWCGCNAVGADFLTAEHPGQQEIANGVAAFQVDAAMAQAVQSYVAEVRRIQLGLPNSVLGVELKTTLNANRWGTSDAVIAQYYGVLHIVDYKNGTSYVPSKRNPQMMIYALGQIVEYQAKGIEFTEVRMTIVQPNAREGEAIREYSMTPAELIVWHNEVLAPADAKCLDPNAPLIPGNWCKDGWCDARHECPALAAHNNQVTMGMFSPVLAERTTNPPTPIMMTSEQRRVVLENRTLVTDWMTQIYNHEYSLHMKGLGSWGKLTKGKANRSWNSPAAAKMKLTTLLHGDIYKPLDLKSPAMVETALVAIGYTKKAAKDMIIDMVKVSAGHPKLVAPDAKGAPINLVNEMFVKQ